MKSLARNGISACNKRKRIDPSERDLSRGLNDVDVFRIFAYDLSLIARLEWRGGIAR